MATSRSNRIFVTPSKLAKEHYLYVQEVGTLESIKPHISKRQNLTSYLFLIVLNGSGSLIYNGLTYELTSGSCAFIDCRYDYSHESSHKNPWQLKWVHFNSKNASDFYSTYIQSSCHPVFLTQRPKEYIECIDTIYNHHAARNAYTDLHSHLELTRLITYCITEQELSSNDSSIDEKLTCIYEELYKNYDKNISLEQLSSQYFISKYHLSRAFKKKYGTTIITALVSIRISKAKELLRFSNTPISEISQQCGFQDPSYFVKAFKKSEGVTPLTYRKKW